MRHYILTALLVALYNCLIAQSCFQIGARVNALAYSSSCIADEWALFNNPAGISGIDKLRFNATYDLFPGFSSFNRTALTVVHPLGKGALSAGLFRFGDELFNEQAIGAGYANKLGIASLGVSLQIIQLSAEGFGRKSVPSISAGGITDLTPWLKIGAYVVNVSQPNITKEEKLPTTLLAGALLKASDKVFVVGEVEKNIIEKGLLKAGVEYQFNRKFVARTGFTPSPLIAFAGFGFHTRAFRLDYAATCLLEIGTKHQMSVSYLLALKK